MGKVTTYSLKNDGSKYVSEHFRVREFAETGTDEIKIDAEVVAWLEAIRADLKATKIYITSGYRTDSTTSQHAKGKAADINVWYRTASGQETRYQGKEILLAAERAGVRGIGWIAGSATSRAAVHIDSRDSVYRFDEANGNRMVAGNSWYTYFGLEKPDGMNDPDPAACPYSEPMQLLQQGSTGDGVKWVQWHLKNTQGMEGIAVDGIFGAKTSAGVKQVQTAAIIKVDGIVGPDTRKALVSVQEPTSETVTYTVKAGDNLTKIARRYGITWQEIAEANNISNPSLIHVGDVLIIP